MTTHRNWCFTLNNHFEICTEPETWKQNLKLLIAVKEVGEAGTPHLQGYLELITPRTLKWVKDRIPRAHLESRKGSKKQAIAYVMKTLELDQLRENGEERNSDCGETVLVNANESTMPLTIIFPPELSILNMYETYVLKSQKLNKRALALQSVKKRIDEGASDLTIANEFFDVWVSNYRAFERYRVLITPPRNHPVEVYVIQGPTGTGKSKYCMDHYPDAYWKQRSQWWDGYSGHKTVIIDEFYGWLPFDLLLRVCDRYPLLVESKGGQLQFVAERIIITTNAIPNNWYKHAYFDSFVRRVTEWWVFPIWGEMQKYIDYSEAMSAFVNNTFII